MKIVFMGTPEFAIPSLEILLKNNYDIVGVITSPDRLGGRGMKKSILSAVKKYALNKNLKILQPKNLKSRTFVDELADLNADLQIVVAFRMLPEVVWNMPPFGTYNLHASLLPAYRGAAPINWAIIKGEYFSGLTTFKLKHAIDTGDLAFQAKVEITIEDTAGSLHDKMMPIGAQLVLKTVRAIENVSIKLSAQDNSKISKAPKLFKENCQVDFSENVIRVYNFIRGLSPYPLSWFMWKKRMIKIHKARFELAAHGLPIGEVVSDKKTTFKIACKDGFIHLDELQMQGKNKLKVKDFLNGTKHLFD